MKPYILSLGAGLLVGIVYSLVGVRSPAPPVIALVGLLGILGGEQVLPLAKRLLGPEAVTSAWTATPCSDQTQSRPGTKADCAPNKETTGEKP